MGRMIEEIMPEPFEHVSPRGPAVAAEVTAAAIESLLSGDSRS